jgi:hypothetical protein
MLRAVILSFTLAAGSAALVQADVIYSDLGSGSFYLYGGDVISSSSDYRPSVEFNSATDNTLTEVDFVASIGNSNTDVNQVTVSLYQDIAGVPGTLVASQEFTGDMGVLGSTSSILSWTPDVAIAPETDYFVTLDGPVPGDVTWNYNLQGQYGYYDYVGGSWQETNNTLGAIQILGGVSSQSSTPEPGTFGLLAIATAGAVFFKRRVQA